MEENKEKVEWKVRRDNVLKTIDEEDKKDKKILMILYAMLQFKYYEMKKPEEERLGNEDKASVSEFVINAASNMETVASDFKKLVTASADEPNDLYYCLIMQVLSQFDKKERKEGEEGKVWLDLENATVHNYASAIICLALRIEDEGMECDAIMKMIEEDEPGAFGIDIETPLQSYKWAKEKYGLISSDMCSLTMGRYIEENMDGKSSEEMIKEGEEALQSMSKIAEASIPMFIESSIGEVGKIRQDKLREHVKAMMDDKEKHEGLCRMFSVGMLSYTFIPQHADVSREIKTRKKQDKLFECLYESLAGEAMKTFYKSLSDAEKRVARMALLAGLMTTIMSTNMSKDGTGLMGIRKGMIYDID